MPAMFDNCVKKGGKVRTKTLGKGKYMHICFLGGNSYPGEVKEYKKVLKK
jgi:putative hemolysin